ncbi:MAG: hypothetical protein HQL63_01625 [Magnetococcales bacterium]|nr:hypothetical protein [Magnetococcales bacterium]
MKTVEQQGMQFLHRIRQRLVKNRTAMGNQARGILAEQRFDFGDPAGDCEAARRR